MSQVNTNKDCLRLMGAAAGSRRDSAAVGGIVSVWFGGFAVGEISSHMGLGVDCFKWQFLQVNVDVGALMMGSHADHRPS